MSFSVPESELKFSASRSGGPGGQHVNKSSTRVEVRWNVLKSRILNDRQRHRLLEKLGNRLNDSGALRVVSSSHRSQLRNREAAIERLNLLVEEALTIPKRRKATKVPRRVVESRLESKRRRSKIKQRRKPIKGDDLE